jgi:hypothetical protein
MRPACPRAGAGNRPGSAQVTHHRGSNAPSGYSSAMPDMHIIPDGDRWNVKEENGDVVSTHDTQAEAEESGKSHARERGGGEVFTHRDEGEFSRIRKGDAV